MSEFTSKIAATLQENDDLDVSRVLLGFVTVAEWVDDQGARWLSRYEGNADGHPIPSWQREGYLHNALNADWDVAPDLDLEDE